MISKNDLRANETKRAILAAAGKLFSQRGFDSVTMREIAKKAKCSHTTIYIYFKDKEALLHELSMPFLLDLKEQMESILLRNDLTSEGKLKSISYEFVRFCLFNRNMFTIFFATRATRVDSKEPVLEINKIRIELFELITRALRECLSIQQNDNHYLSMDVFISIHCMESLGHIPFRRSPTRHCRNVCNLLLMMRLKYYFLVFSKK